MNLQDFMKQQGISVKQLSDENPKVSNTTLKRAFSGENLNDNSIKNIAEALKITEGRLKKMLRHPPSSDYVAVLVYESLNILSALHLDFKPQRDKPNTPIYLAIEEDLCGELSYFPDEFDSLVNKAETQAQFVALKQLVLYCTAFMVDRETDIDLKSCSQLTLCGGSNAWELRIYINARLEKLEGLKFELHTSKETGASKLAPVNGAHQLGLSGSTDEMEMFLDLARQINEKVPLTDEPCPDLLRKDNKEDLAQFEKYCRSLNERLVPKRNTVKNIFAFSEGVTPEKVSSLVSDYLPALRIVTIQADQGKSFLITGDLKVQAVLIEYLEMIAQRENRLLGKSKYNEEKAMSENQIINNFNAPVGTAISGSDNHVEINTKLSELIPVLEELKARLIPNHSRESEEIKALDEAVKQASNSPEYLNVLDDALKKTEKIVNKGTQVGKLYNKAELLLKGLMALI